MSYTGERAFSEGAEICAALSSQQASLGGCLPEASATCGDGVLDSGEECDDRNLAPGDGCSAQCQVECGHACSSSLAVTAASADAAEAASVCLPGCGNGVVDWELGEACDLGAYAAFGGSNRRLADHPCPICSARVRALSWHRGAQATCCVDCELAPGAQCCGGECCDGATGAYHSTTTRCAGGVGHCDGQGGCATAAELCDRYTNMAFDQAACPVTSEAACRPHCLLLHEGGQAATCYHPPEPDPISAPWSVFADGAACVAPDGRAGACTRGWCVARGVCGDGTVDAEEECDDASSCCEGCKLAAFASCSGDCCDDDCTPRPTGASAPSTGGSSGGGSGRACEAAGGVCVSGACFRDDAALWVNGASIDMGGGAISTLEIDTQACPPLGGGCELQFKIVQSGECHAGPPGAPYALPDGTSCAGEPGAGAGRCMAGACALPDLAQCGDGVRQGNEACDEESACCAQAACVLVPGAQCAADDECCDAASCQPQPTSAPCAGGAGVCMNGRCLTAASAIELGVQRDAWQNVALDVAVCPLRDGCTLQLKGDADGACGARAVALPPGTPCTASGSGTGRCVLVGGNDGVCAAVSTCGNGLVEPGEECDAPSSQACCLPPASPHRDTICCSPPLHYGSAARPTARCRWARAAAAASAVTTAPAAPRRPQRRAERIVRASARTGRASRTTPLAGS